MITYAKKLVLIAITSGLCTTSLESKADTVNVFAASSLVTVLSEVRRQYLSKSSEKIKNSFAASSTLANQIARGAPSDIFISANKSWMNFLEKQSAINISSKKPFLLNRIVLAAYEKNWRPIEVLTKKTVNTLLSGGRLSIGDPTHVPAGIYGKQALQTLGLWKIIQDRLAPAANVRAALAMVERNETPIGLIYRTDALNSKKVKIVFTFQNTSLNQIEYIMAIVQSKERPAVKAYYNFIMSPAVKHIYARFGFELP